MKERTIREESRGRKTSFTHGEDEYVKVFIIYYNRDEDTQSSKTGSIVENIDVAYDFFEKTGVIDISIMD
jgi:hypothetical protein